ncbi:hypothetical protein GCM10009739_15600 [Microbacterium ulmi]
MQAKRALSQNGTRRFARGRLVLPVAGAPGDRDAASAAGPGSSIIMSALSTLSRPAASGEACHAWTPGPLERPARRRRPARDPDRAIAAR